jgi:hypothetical protein
MAIVSLARGLEGVSRIACTVSYNTLPKSESASLLGKPIRPKPYIDAPAVNGGILAVARTARLDRILVI